MQVQSFANPVPSFSRSLPPSPVPQQADPTPAETFTRSNNYDQGPNFQAQGNFGQQLVQTAVIGGIALAGAGLGVYAGLNTGFLAGVAGAAAGASGGAIVAAHATRGQNIKLGAVAGMLTGALVGATVAHPAAAVALGASGLSVPYGGILAIFSSIE
jgi:hypothetical protein